MKKQHFILRGLALILAAGLLFTACKKGDNGPTGPKGEQGEKGDKGPTGTANVIYSDWIDVQFTSGQATMNAPQLTQDILDKGEISMFWRAPFLTPGTYVYYKLNYHQESAQYKVEYFPALGKITLTSGTSYTNSKLTLRYILIPGGVKATSNLNFDDYNSVKKTFNMKD